MKEISDDIKTEKFEAFYQWLKEDGLVARRSERMLRKRIFRNLLGNEEMTMENFEDFLIEEKKKKKPKRKKPIPTQVETTEDETIVHYPRYKTTRRFVTPVVP